MHSYQHHIGDYRRDTAHLSLLEHGIYRQLLDWYYLDEAPIPRETQVVMRRLSARTEEEQKAVEVVLQEFFELREEGWFQRRCDTEIRWYQANAERARENGKRGGRPKKTEPVISEKPSNNPEATQKKANQEPVTSNQGNPPTSSNEDVSPKAAKKKSEACTFADWLVKIKASGEKAISDYRPVFDYAETVGLPVEWVELAWLKFRQRYTTDQKAKRKRYTDWRQVFLNAVKDNWLKLWWFRDGEAGLTTVGQQAELEHRKAA